MIDIAALTDSPPVGGSKSTPGLVVPQANRLEGVRDLVAAVKAGSADSSSLAETLGIGARHVAYYRQAAVVLGLLLEDDDGVRVAERGSKLLALAPGSPAERDALRACVTDASDLSPFHAFFTDPKATVEELARSIQEFSGLSYATAFRRAKTLEAWRSYVGTVDSALPSPRRSQAAQQQRTAPAPQQPHEAVPTPAGGKATSMDDLVEKLRRASDPTAVVSPTVWREWASAVRDSGHESANIGELADRAGVPWPVSRRHEPLGRYLGSSPSQILAMKGVGRKKLRSLLLAVAELLREPPAVAGDTVDDEPEEESEVGTKQVEGEEVTLRKLRDSLFEARDPTSVVSAAQWADWAASVRQLEQESTALGELCDRVGLPWPVSRRDEPLDRYLHRSPDEILKERGFGRKKIRSLFLAVLDLLLDQYPEVDEDLAGSQEPRAKQEPDAVPTIVEALLSSLSERDREVLELRFGMNQHTPHTLAEIGDVVGVTRERVRQIESKKLRVLSAKKESDALRDRVRLDADRLWRAVANNHGIVRVESNSALAERLRGEDVFAIRLGGQTPFDWVKSVATNVGSGWYRGPLPAHRIERVLHAIEHAEELLLPSSAEEVAQTLGDSPDVVRVAAALGDNISLHAGYVLRGRLTSRKRRAVWLHRILAQKCQEAESVATLEAVTAQNALRPADTCSYRDAEIVFARHPHLFLNMGRGRWRALGGKALPNNLNDEDEADLAWHSSEEPEASEPDTLTEALQALLTKTGPMRLSQLMERFEAEYPGRYARASVGVMLITTGKFLRLAPGLYALPQHLRDEQATRQAEQALLDRASCSKFVRARYCGEPLASFPLWNRQMERRWAEWAESRGETDLMESLLCVAEPQEWPVSGDGQRQRWLKKKASARYDLDPEAREPDWATPPDARDILVALVLAAHRDVVGWVGINRALRHRMNDRSAIQVLAVLVALGVLRAPNDPRSSHVCLGTAEPHLAPLLNELHRSGSVEWQSPCYLDLVSRVVASCSGPDIGWVKRDRVKKMMERTAADNPGSSDERMSVATLEGLLALSLAIAEADGFVHPDETLRIRALGEKRLGQLPENEREQARASIHRLEAEPDPTALAQRLAVALSARQKRRLMADLFAVAAADGVFCEAERTILKKMQTVLQVDESYFQALEERCTAEADLINRSAPDEEVFDEDDEASTSSDPESAQTPVSIDSLIDLVMVGR